MRAGVERRVHFVLRRISARVPRAEVRFTDENGPRGGIDKRCRLALRTDGAGEVVISSVAKDWRTALDDALARAARFVQRMCQHSGTDRRQRPRTIEQDN